MLAKIRWLTVAGALILVAACASTSTTPSSTKSSGGLPISNSPTVTVSNTIAVTLAETDAKHMSIGLSGTVANAGKVTFIVANTGKKKHEFVVLKTPTLAANFAIASFESESDRIDEDAAGTNVGETGDMEPGTTKTLTIDLAPGHYALVCNLQGHYRMGMHLDFTVQPPANTIVVTLGETNAQQMFLDLSGATATSGKVTFLVSNAGKKTHEFVVLKTDTPAASFTIGSFEQETDRIDEDAAGTNVGETGDMKAGSTKTLTLTLAPGHYALVCNLQGHYRMGMRKDFTVS
jgi:uncharacterized cupredoxin-like copper-binding protein